MYYFIYKTVNLINNKYYYGAHSTKNINDSYLGSGVALKKAIQKYGKENFKREIVEFFDNEEDLYASEAEIVNENYLKEDCYNMNKGGKGGWNYVNSTDINKGKNNIMYRSPGAKHIIIENGKKTRAKNPEKYKKIAIKNLEKATEKNKGSKRPEHSVFMKKFISEFWDSNKEYMRDCLSSTFKITSNEGIEIITNRLQEWCESMGLPYTTLWVSSSRNGKIITKGRAKGWKCELIRIG